MHIRDRESAESRDKCLNCNYRKINCLREMFINNSVNDFDIKNSAIQLTKHSIRCMNWPRSCSLTLCWFVYLGRSGRSLNTLCVTKLVPIIRCVGNCTRVYMLINVYIYRKPLILSVSLVAVSVSLMDYTLPNFWFIKSNFFGVTSQTDGHVVMELRLIRLPSNPT